MTNLENIACGRCGHRGPKDLGVTRAGQQWWMCLRCDYVWSEASIETAHEPFDTVARRTTVRAAIEAVVEAWNRGDVIRYAALFVPEAELVDLEGVHVVGRDKIIAHFEHGRMSRAPGSVLFLRTRRFDFLSPTAVVVLTEGHIERSDAEAIQVRPTFVLLCEEGRWRVVFVNNVRVVFREPSDE